MKRYHERLYAIDAISTATNTKVADRLTVCRIRMRIGIEFVPLVSKPKAAIRVKDLLAERRQELLKDTSTVDTSSK